MPICSRCGRMDATVELRRSPKKAKDGGTLWLCKERLLCSARRREARKHERALKKAAASSQG